ncbi:MAG: bifunctional 5,10-methylene-tetrahydrofolate dehydrogenase/5,10-methylene-tetrahydrofolate cyclohydrolase [Sphingobacteriales bacterium]|nr:MAG: bifunctional 5,10-methylene-tetrahydrofolate dehydrogenase/5,10-methylene-tetrahydrofolate cyclohydrolase [Sphingobacteriales bacterium]
MKLLDGKYLAEIIKKEIKSEVDSLVSAGLKTPHLAAVLVGDDGASQTYVQSKIRACKEVGFDSTILNLSKDISESELLATIERLNKSTAIDGFIVQLPLPKHINENNITQAVNFRKDVDGFHPINIGRMAQGLPCYLPATPLGIMLLLERNGIETSGKECVVVGRSNIVGTPMSILLSRNSYPGNCTVTLCHSRTKNLPKFTKRADILIAALGNPEFIKGNMVKKDAVVIDVGITRIEDSSKKTGYRIVGDVKFKEVAPKCSFITPVPGGVGPMTVVSLLLNTLKSAKNMVYLQ